ncbi:MAG: hypothetical protein IIC21_00525 [Chloroflexi bacterium]|nr:hypothetical protein [Chloroflexota bacterium]
MKLLLVFAALVPFGIFFLAQSHVAAQSPDGAEQMLTANQLYEDAEYVESANAYQQLVGQGYTNVRLYHNLGNAYYKRGELGRALVNYLRAQRLSPRDADVKANLELARSQTVEKLDLKRAPLFTRLSLVTVPWMTFNETALATVAAWYLLAITFAALVLMRGKGPRKAVFSLVLVFLLMFGTVSIIFGSRSYAVATGERGVIVMKSTEFSSGPGTSYKRLSTLHEGAEARVLTRRGSWTKIELFDAGRQGWVEARAVEAVGIP